MQRGSRRRRFERLDAPLAVVPGPGYKGARPANRYGYEGFCDLGLALGNLRLQAHTDSLVPGVWKHQALARLTGVSLRKPLGRSRAPERARTSTNRVRMRCLWKLIDGPSVALSFEGKRSRIREAPILLPPTHP